MARLDDSGFLGAGRGGDVGHLGEEAALVVSSAPWSITFSVSSWPMMAAVTWMPPVPQP